MGDGEIDVLLVCSPGGHLLQLVALQDSWRDLDRLWVTLDAPDARSLLAGERVVYAYGPTNRSLRSLLRNLLLARRLMPRLRPAVVLTTGAGVAVPFAWLGRLYGAKVVYIESLTRIDSVSLSCRMIRPVADRLYAQWPELLELLPRARYVGSVVGGS